ncbi:MAG: hypothetical protein M0005_06710 [Actinomycetota bacterium]|jgi:hypothetical protein|nr:hypothetical protein [Actinomycetota bacterium]
MRRQVFDVLVSAGGIVIAIVLLVAGSLLMWAQSFAASSVHYQLARQEIYFPPKSHIPPAQRSYLDKYAGKQVLTPPEAHAYAMKIASDVSGLPYHGIYAKLSAASIAHPNNKKLAADVATSFKASTLQGLLLEAYGFGTFGIIALWAAVASFCFAFVILSLVALGFYHARTTPPEAELLAVLEH